MEAQTITVNISNVSGEIHIHVHEGVVVVERGTRNEYVGSFNEENIHVHDAHNRATTNNNTARGKFYSHIVISKRSDDVSIAPEVEVEVRFSLLISILTYTAPKGIRIVA